MAWVLLTENQRQVWRDAVRRPGMSGYDLYMSENMHCFHDGDGGPAGPSPSGGYSTMNVVCNAPDGLEVPEACEHEEPPPVWAVGEDCDNFDAGTVPKILLAQPLIGHFRDPWDEIIEEMEQMLLQQVFAEYPEYCYYAQVDEGMPYGDLVITPQMPYAGWWYVAEHEFGTVDYTGNPENIQDPPVDVNDVYDGDWAGTEVPLLISFSYI